jgi:hypothetical protein
MFAVRDEGFEPPACDPAVAFESFPFLHKSRMIQETRTYRISTRGHLSRGAVRSRGCPLLLDSTDDLPKQKAREKMTVSTEAVAGLLLQAV